MAGEEEQALAATEAACRVYVGNLLPKAKESHLTSKFARFGTIHSVWIARRPPGFAFVRFATPDAAQRAVEACREDGAMEILGKAVRVQMAGDKDRKHSLWKKVSPWEMWKEVALEVGAEKQKHQQVQVETTGCRSLSKSQSKQQHSAEQEEEEFAQLKPRSTITSEEKKIRGE
ncbi:ribosomal protein s6 [Phytophthora cinnamomi]|uniref:ribosomal protein s6 n=1 Tax=Phytophthora cinnamomi TaxID=4785 RepID=UPI00355A2B28|nr:ribosomal protein s6 [Phytophthora cinnamomi]